MMPSGGPYLTMAVLCERPLIEKDDVLSVIRIVERITIQVPVDPAMPEAPLSATVNLTAVLQFKSGQARGRHTIRLRPEAPSGLKMQEVSLSVLFEGEDRGVNLIVALALRAEQEGLYWFDVLLDDQLFTRIPLRLVLQRMSAGLLPRT